MATFWLYLFTVPTIVNYHTSYSGSKKKKRKSSQLTNVVPQPQAKHQHAQRPKHHAQRLGHAQLGVGGPVLDVEGQGDGDGDDGHVDRDAQVGEEGALVGAVVARVARLVLEEQRPQGRPGEEG